MCFLELTSVSHRDSGYLVRVARLLVYMCPPTSMWTGALALVSWAGVGIPAELRGDTGDTETSCWADMLPLLLLLLSRLSWDTKHTRWACHTCFLTLTLCLLLIQHPITLQNGRENWCIGLCLFVSVKSSCVVGAWTGHYLLNILNFVYNVKDVTHSDKTFRKV